MWVKQLALGWEDFISLNKSAGVKEENQSRSSRSSMIWRLKPVSLSVIRSTRFISTGPSIGPTRESSPGHPLWATPFSMRCCSRAFFVHLFWIFCLPFLPETWLSLARRGSGQVAPHRFAQKLAAAAALLFRSAVQFFDHLFRHRHHEPCHNASPLPVKP